MRQFSQFSCSVVSDSLRPHESQHTRPPCPSPTPRVYSHSCPSSLWCHPAISSSVVPFSSCPQSLPASGSFQMSQLFTWGGQSIEVSASASVLPVNTQDWSPLGWTGWNSRVFSKTTVQKHQFFSADVSSQSNSQHPHMTTGKTIALTRNFVGKVMRQLVVRKWKHCVKGHRFQSVDCHNNERKREKWDKEWIRDGGRERLLDLHAGAINKWRCFGQKWD